MSRPIEKKDLSGGINAITHEDIRWQYCDIKAITLLPSVLLRHKAKQQGAKEAILIRDGYLTEGAASNVFICKNNEIFTPPKNNTCFAWDNARFSSLKYWPIIRWLILRQRSLEKNY